MIIVSDSCPPIGSRETAELEVGLYVHGSAEITLRYLPQLNSPRIHMSPSCARQLGEALLAAVRETRDEEDRP